MANTATIVSGSMNRATWRIDFDGSGTTWAISQAKIAADLALLKVPNTGVPGTPKRLNEALPEAPIVALLTKAFVAPDQAALRTATIEGPCKGYLRPRTTAAPAAVANAVGFSVDVDVDGTTPTKMQIKGQGPSTAGVSIYVDMVVGYSVNDGPNCAQ